MVIDTSLLLAICLRESVWGEDWRLIVESSLNRVSAVSVFEASMVISSRLGQDGLDRLDRLLAASRANIELFDAAQAALARDAFLRYGKGRHKARLNFGDCCVYALARQRGEPLLYRGADFAQTDISTAK